MLNFVQQHAIHPMIYPMLVLAAHTGVRRSEILCSEVVEFDLSAHTVRLRELKLARGKRTMRNAPMSGRLTDVKRNWLKQAGGRYTFTFNMRRLTPHRFLIAPWLEAVGKRFAAGMFSAIPLSPTAPAGASTNG